MTIKIEKGQALTSLSLMPLLDVVFLLLIFFLVATRFAQEERELPVDLPTASEARPLTEEPKVVIVNIDSKGSYFLEGKTMTLDQLEQALQRAVQNNPVHQSVILRADRRVQLDFVTAVMNVCNKVNIRDYKLTTSGDIEP